MAIPKAEILGVKITTWEPGRLGVSYRAADGKIYRHEIGVDDLPIIERFEQAGALAFVNDAVRDAWTKPWRPKKG